MKKNKKKVFIIFLATLFITMVGTMTFAHAGRTDSNGGHKDKNNVSGLGPYHYHCGGHPAHLHPDGKCPYSSSSGKSQSKTNNSSSSKSSSKKSNVSSSSSNSNEEAKQTKAIEESSTVKRKTDEETKVKEKENVKTSVTNKNNSNSNNINRNSDDSNPAAGILALGLLGGGGYVGYKKYKEV